jgi:hypothetical protein
MGRRLALGGFLLFGGGRGQQDQPEVPPGGSLNSYLVLLFVSIICR